MADDSGSPVLPEAEADAAPAAPAAVRKPPTGGSRPAAEGKPVEPGESSDKNPGATKTSALKSKGVPKQRLLWWALPTGGGVAGVGMYSGNPMIALIAIGAALLAGAGALAVRVARGAGGRGAGAAGRRPSLGGRGPGAGGGRGPGAGAGRRPGLGGLMDRFRNRGGRSPSGAGPGGRPGAGRTPGGRSPVGGGRTPGAGRAPGAGKTTAGPNRPGLPAGRSARPGGKLNPMNWFGGGGPGGKRPATSGGTRTPGAGAGIKPPAAGRTPGTSRQPAAGGRPGGRLNPMNWLGGGAGGRTPGTGRTPGGPGTGRTSAGGGRGWWPFGGRKNTTSASGPRTPGGGRTPGSTTSASTTNSASGRRRWWPFGGRTTPRTATSTAPPQPNPASGQSTNTPPRRRWRRTRQWWQGRQNPASTTASSSTGTNSGPAQNSQQHTSTPPPQPAQRWSAERLDDPAAPAAVWDPLQISAAPAETAQEPLVAVDELAARRAERGGATDSQTWVEQHPTDDGGFPLYPPPAPIRRNDSPAATAAGDLREYDTATTNTPASPAVAGASTTKGTPDMSINTAEYTSKIDNTTPQNYKSSLEQGSADASRTAGVWDERASDARRSAANLDGNPEMADARDGFLQAAGRAEKNAEDHRAMASGLQSEADNVKVS